MGFLHDKFTTTTFGERTVTTISFLLQSPKQEPKKSASVSHLADTNTSMSYDTIMLETKKSASLYTLVINSLITVLCVFKFFIELKLSCDPVILSFF